MKKSAIFLSIIFFLICIGCSDQSNSNQYYHVEHQSDYNLHGGTCERLSSENELVQQAISLLDQPITAVTQKPSTSHISDARNYVSMACYWWPDPNSPDGNPYIRKDGEVNPETRSQQSDLPKLIEMAQRVEVLSLAYKCTENEKFAKMALVQLEAWFINKESAMHPHLEHAQMVKGRNLGRSYGVIDTWWLVRVVESLPYLKKSVYWTQRLEEGLQAWFTHYLNWLRNSEFGQAEMQSKNNHGTWYDLQVVTFARFVDQHDFARSHLENVTQRRIARQITPFGRQKYETRRSRPHHYSIYNLSGLMKLALHGKALGVDLRNNNRWLSGSLEEALLFLIQDMNGIDPASLKDEYDQTNTNRLYENLMFNGWKLFDRNEINYELMRLHMI